MFNIREPSFMKQPWRLSSAKEIDMVTISQEILTNLRRQDVLSIDYLYQSYRSKLKGVILNEENDMNTCLQVSAFLGALSRSFSKQFLVLVLTPDKFLPHWHFHLMKHGGLKVDIITPDTRPNEFDEETNLALLLSFSNLKLAQGLVECNFFSVIIDSFDAVAQKLAIRKLEADFNIGLTSRNFYSEPDQKLQWTMLNWSNPGVFGKLANFYEIDNNNFASYRNSYKTWWFRLTWQFCNSLKPYTDREKSEYQNAIEDWKKTYSDLQKFEYIDIFGKNIKPKKYVKKEQTSNIRIKEEKQLNNDNTRTNTKNNQNLLETKKEKVTYKSRGKNKKLGAKIKYGVMVNTMENTKIVKNREEINDSNSSVDTIIYEDSNLSPENLVSANLDEKTHVSPKSEATNEESDITSIINLKYKEEIEERQLDSQESDKTSLEKDFLLSLIDEPAKKRIKINEKIKDNLTKESDHDDLLLTLLPKNGFLKGKVFDSTFESENVQTEKTVENRTLNLDLEVEDDSEGEADTFLFSLIKGKSNVIKSTKSNSNKSIDFKYIVQESSKSHEKKIGENVDLKKLEDMLRETDTY